MSNEPEKRSEWWMSPEDLAKVAAGHREMVAIQSMKTETEVFTDILIPDVESGVYVRVATRLDAMAASEFSYEYAQHNRERGCMLWPHGVPTPSQWTVIDESDE